MNPSTPMSRKPSIFRTFVRCAIGLVAVAAVALGGPWLADASESDGGRHTRRVEVDIAEDGTRFVIDEAPVFDDGFPAYGNPFVTQGYIYPAGTLSESDGVNPDGSPQYPDKVIGEWSCRGYFIADGAHTTEGSWVYTTQLFAFGENPTTGARPSSSPATREPRSARM